MRRALVFAAVVLAFPALAFVVPWVFVASGLADEVLGARDALNASIANSPAGDWLLEETDWTRPLMVRNWVAFSLVVGAWAVFTVRRYGRTAPWRFPFLFSMWLAGLAVYGLSVTEVWTDSVRELTRLELGLRLGLGALTGLAFAAWVTSAPSDDDAERE